MLGYAALDSHVLTAADVRADGLAQLFLHRSHPRARATHGLRERNGCKSYLSAGAPRSQVRSQLKSPKSVRSREICH
ncbi:hypothetical protein MRB53_040294 [Persea americana]|nr:hypothetical protein MRB53_040294 [Persea americana]